MLSTKAALIIAVVALICLLTGGWTALRDRQTYEDRESDAFTAFGLLMIGVILFGVAGLSAIV